MQKWTNHLHFINSIEKLINKFASIFQEKVEFVQGLKITLNLRKGVKPIFIKECNVPYVLQVSVENEMNSLKAKGIIISY